MGDNNLRNFVPKPLRYTQNRRTKRTIRWSAVGAITGAIAGTALAAIPTLASIFARTVVTPEPQPAEDVRVIKRSEEHTSELQSRGHLVCRLLLEKKNRYT